MADSNITKRALSSAFKELLESKPFSKISVGDICEKCEMNRKSFYYHFKDKYDLVNWIYYTEFVTVVRQKDYPAFCELVTDLCRFFYDNGAFYHKILSVSGQNSFTEYFRDLLVTIMNNYREDSVPSDAAFSFCAEFYGDAMVCAIKRWLSQKNCMPPEEFSSLLEHCLRPVFPSA